MILRETEKIKLDQQDKKLREESLTQILRAKQ